MEQDSVITDEMKKMLGVESEPSVFEIEREPIRRWAEAIGDPNPLYHNEEYARKTRFGGMIAPPGFVQQYRFPVRMGAALRRVRSPFTMNLNGGDEYEFFKPVRPGDVITAAIKLADLFERQSSNPQIGRMLFQIHETTYKNQNGEVVAIHRGTGISYEGPKKA